MESAESDSCHRSKRLRLGSKHESNPWLFLLPEGCLCVMLSFLSARDADMFTLCSKFCRQVARKLVFSGRTLTGFLNICPEPGRDMVRTLVQCFVSKATNHRFFQSGPRHLKIRGIRNLEMKENWGWIKLERFAEQNHLPQLNNVISLDISGANWSKKISIGTNVCVFFCLLCPELEAVDLSYVPSARLAFDALRDFAPNLKRLTYRPPSRAAGPPVQMTVRGESLPNAKELEEIVLNGMRFGKDRYPGRSQQLLECCPNVERVDIYNATVGGRPLPDRMVMEFVRQAEMLTLLRCNLSQENVNVLRNERPDITFLL